MPDPFNYDEMIHTAKSVWDRGYYLLPLRITLDEAGDKKVWTLVHKDDPVYTWERFKERARLMNSPKYGRRYATGLGLMCQASNISVLDIDQDYHDPQGLCRHFISRCLQGGIEPPMTRTRSGGVHLIFRAERGLERSLIKKLHPHLDWISTEHSTRYVVGGGSCVVENGYVLGRYRGYYRNDPPPVPQWLRDMIQETYDRDTLNLGSPLKMSGVLTLADLQPMERIELMNIRDRIVGHSDRSAVEWLLIKRAKELGLSQDATYEFMRKVGKVRQRGKSYFDHTWERCII